MSYTALYRKWRPATFDDVKGQDAIVKTLKNQILANRIGHAYLFCGTRGTGKTSVAKIYAKAVNCENPQDGNPCGECQSCREISSGNSMNVIEIDAASNNGVENIREIRENVAYSPTNAKYKVYIIDEVHMLSTGAFNALLKTLEEPPSYVIFILATTESHKIPVTILSRCQRYDFKRISIDTIVSRLKQIMDAESIMAEDKAIRYIAKCAEGGMRDAISLLDQCVAFYLGKEITYENTLEVLGAVDTEVFSLFLRAIAAESIVDAVHVLDTITVQGRDLSQFVIDFTWYLRNVLLTKMASDVEEIIDVNADNLKALREEAVAVEANTLIRYIRIFSELSNELRYAAGKRILIEIAIIKICKPQTQKDFDSVLERVRVLEKRIENGDFVSGSHVNAEEMAKRKQAVKQEEEDKKKLIDSLPKATQEDLGKIAVCWKDIVRIIPGQYKASLREATPSVDPRSGKLVIVVKDLTMISLVQTEDGREEIEKAISKVMGKKVDFELMAKTALEEKGERLPQANIFGMPVEVNDSEF